MRIALTIDLRKHEHLRYDYTREELPDESQFFMHVHTDMEIYYLVRGHVEYHVENSVYTPSPGDILIMRPGEVHSSLAACDAPYERFNLRFAPELLKETLNGRLLAPFLERPMGVGNLYRAEELPSDYIRTCLDRMFVRENVSEMRVLSYLLPVLQEIYDVWVTRDRGEETQPTSLPAKIISYINQNLTTLHNPQQLSDAFFMSQSQIYRVFRAYTGTSVWEYVRTKRLYMARELLLSGIAPHKAAADCGYQDYSTFYRAYKKQFGHSPQEEQKA